MYKTVLKPVSFLLIWSFLLLNVNLPKAQAQMIGTDSVITAQRGETQRQKVATFLAREDVKQVMAQQGVDAVEAQNRVASLSDDEVAKLAGSIDSLPAGGDGIGTVIGAAVFIFIVLLLTDILGLTHVFPFVNHSHAR